MHPKRIVMMDRNAHEIGIASEALTAEGFTISVSRDFEDAVELVRDLQPSAVLVDWDSLGSAEQVRHFVDACRNADSEPCFVVMADKCHAADNAQSVGLNYFVPKPFDHLLVSVTVSACID